MRKLLMTSALVMPLLAMPAFAQEAQAPLPENEPAGQAEPAAEGAEPEVEVSQEEPEVEVTQEEPAVEVTQEEPQVEVVQEEPEVEVIREGEAEEPATAEEPAAADQPEMAEEPVEAEEPEMAEEPVEAEAPEMAEEPVEGEAVDMAEEPAGPTPEAVVSEMSAEELRGDWVIGTDVVSPEDETIGQIQDVILTPDGQVSAAVLSVGGFLGLGAKNIAVDWSELQIAQDGQEIMLDLTREEAEQAPEYAFREQEQPEAEAAPAAEPVPAAPEEPAAAQ